MKTSDSKSKKNCAHSPCAGRLTTWSRGGGGTLLPHRTKMEVLRRNPQQPDGPTKTGQMHVHWYMQAWTTNGDAMPAVLDRRGHEVQSAPWFWPIDSRRRESLLTNGLRSQLREQQGGRGRDCPRVLDKCAAKHDGLGREQRRPREHTDAGGDRVHELVRPVWCQWRAEHH